MPNNVNKVAQRNLLLVMRRVSVNAHRSSVFAGAEWVLIQSSWAEGVESRNVRHSIEERRCRVDGRQMSADVATSSACPSMKQRARGAPGQMGEEAHDTGNPTIQCSNGLLTFEMIVPTQCSARVDLPFARRETASLAQTNGNQRRACKNRAVAVGYR